MCALVDAEQLVAEVHGEDDVEKGKRAGVLLNSPRENDWSHGEVDEGVVGGREGSCREW